MDPLDEEAVHPAMPEGTIGHGAQTSEEVRLATDRPQTNDRRKTHMRLGDLIPGTGVMRIKEEVITVIRTEGKTQSPYQGAMMLKRGIQETLHQWPFLTRLSRTNERSEKSRRVFKKPRCSKDKSDGCIDTWIELRKLHFEEEDLSERQECSDLNRNCVMAKKQYQRDMLRNFLKSC